MSEEDWGLRDERPDIIDNGFSGGVSPDWDV